MSIHSFSRKGIETEVNVPVGFCLGLALAMGFPEVVSSSFAVSIDSVTYLSTPFTILTHETSRDGFRLGKTHSAAQGTRWTQTHPNMMLGNFTVGTRKTSISKSSGHEEQHRRSLHETSGWIANKVACGEPWASNSGWYKWYEWTERG